MNDKHIFSIRQLRLVIYPKNNATHVCWKRAAFVAAGGNKHLKSLGLAACHINAPWICEKIISGRRILQWCSWVTRAKMQP